MAKRPENYFSFVTRIRGVDRNVGGDSELSPSVVNEMLDMVNCIAANLADLRSKADAGDVKAMYDANLQIEMLRNAKQRLADAGGRFRFNSSSHVYELV